MLEVPDGFIFQLWSKERVELGQNCNQPKEIAAGFPGGAVVKNLPANAGHTGSIPGPGRSHVPQSN